MPGRVEALPLRQEHLGVEVRVEDALLVPERPGEVRAVGREDGGAATADSSSPSASGTSSGSSTHAGRRSTRGRRRATRGRCGASSRATSPVLCGRSEVELDAALVEREARKRHEVLPADQAADAAEVGLDCPEPAAVAEAPDHALVVRRHELAVVQRELAVRPVEQERVVDRAAVELVRADRQPEPVLARRRCRCAPRPRTAPPATRAPAARRRASPRRRLPRGSAPSGWSGYAGEKGLGEEHELRALARRLGGDLFQGSIVASRSKSTGSTWAHATVTGSRISRDCCFSGDGRATRSASRGRGGRPASTRGGSGRASC